VTIAACYLSSEGVVFGADSTTTIVVAGRGPSAIPMERHFDHAQKIYEIGTESTLGIATWGMGNLEGTSYRTLIARFADSLVHQPAQSVADAAGRWNAFFWAAYARELAPQLQRVQELLGRQTRTTQEQGELDFLLQAFGGGFAVGGYLRHERVPQAFEMSFDPRLQGPGPVRGLAPGIPHFWGISNLFERLTYGIDPDLFDQIVRSGRWTGTAEDLHRLVEPYILGRPQLLPIRDAIDWIHASLYTAIKTMKFSHLAPVCGGPIEIAAIATDRPFRWVCHQTLAIAIREGASHV
jgi:hypothetical protein